MQRPFALQQCSARPSRLTWRKRRGAERTYGERGEPVPMKSIKQSYWLLLVLLSALWLLAGPRPGATAQFFPLRNALVNYTGVIGIGVMSVGLLLAMRPARLEPFLGGLDKFYRLHKWLGITALLFSVTHWLWAKGPKWAVGWGWMERPQRAPRPTANLAGLEGLLRGQRGLAEGIGEWAFYIAVLLIGLALLKRFPYRYFFQTHRLLALVYLGLVFHAVVLMDFGDWSRPLGLLLGTLMGAGSIAALLSLLRKVGAGRRALGVIDTLELHSGNQVLRVGLTLRGRWAGHRAGQFAFVTFDPKEGPHPFTITSDWRGDGRLSFHIKGLGDYTRTLPQRLKPGDSVQLEGPYGQFQFESAKTRQVWIAGGIGIAPFLARLKALDGRPDGKPIDLFYSTSMPDKTFIARLQALAAQARVRLHVLVADVHGRLDAGQLTAALPQWREADFWFCGPAGFGRTLRAGLRAAGMPAKDFHQELFEMR
jgi:predicted ferric reductase